VSTRKSTPIKVTIGSVAPPVDCWLDLQKQKFIIELADGKRIESDLTPEEFERKRRKGVRVYDRSKDEDEDDG
jgi:hypothetical protein